MNLTKSLDYFSPLNVKQRCHIIGCGSVGSTVAELLTRLGISKISLYDFDTVDPHNLANQMFYQSDVNTPKVEAVKNMITSINPDAAPDMQVFNEGWNDKVKLSGYVFLCVDNIDLRRKIATKNKMNSSIAAMFDFRTRVEDAQHYAADWQDAERVDNFIRSMDFSHEEAKEQTPVTACNLEIGVAPTVRIICSFGVANFMNFIKGKTLKSIILIDAFGFNVDAY